MANRVLRLALVFLIVALGAQARAFARAPYSLDKVLARAPAGAVVTVPPGVHVVHLQLDKPITLVGSTGAVLSGGGQGDVIRIQAPGVAIRDLTIRDSGANLTDMNAGIFVAANATGAVISHNQLDNVLFGIYLNGTARVTVDSNTVVGMAQLQNPNRGDGIHLWNDRDCIVSNNDVSLTRDGIYVYISPDNTIEYNRIHDVRYGVHYMYSKHNVLRGNISYRNTAGYALMSSDHLEVVDNQAWADMSYGILLNYINYSEIHGNGIRDIPGQFDAEGQIIPGAEGKAIFVYLCQGNTISGNLLAHSRIGIHVTAGSTENHVFDNAFVANRVQVKYVQNVTEQWSRNGLGNYWSNYTGWDLDGDGIGDVPYRPNDGVDVLMWKYPSAKLLMSSPSVLLLRYVQRAFPVFTPPGVTDSHPLMQLPLRWRSAVYAVRH